MTRETLSETFRRMSETAGYATPPGPAASWWALAEATREAQARGWWLDLEPDHDAAGDFDVDLRAGYVTEDQRPSDGYWCALLYAPPAEWDDDPRVIGALGGIDAEPGDPYYRVIYAELAAQALAEQD